MSHIGQICAYCRTPLRAGDTVAVCSSCNRPHHLACWQANQGCPTAGCSGSIREVVTLNPAAPQPAQPYSPAPAPITPRESQLETLRESKDLVFFYNAPVVLESTAIVFDRFQNRLFANCTFRSITDQPIKAVLIEVSCQDTWGAPLGEPIVFQYLDLNLGRDAKFGQNTPIALADVTTRKVQISVTKVLLANNAMVSGDGVAFTMPAPTPLNQYLGSRELIAEYARETTSRAAYVPQEAAGYWLCTCGTLNTPGELNCHSCGCAKAMLVAALNPAALQQSFSERQAAEQRAQAEQAERIRLAEEQTRLERERKEQEARIAAAAARAKKRRKRTITAIIVSAVLAVALTCGTIFFGIPYYHYHTAQTALENGEYDTAYQGFVDLEGFMDSEVMANETLYQKAQNALRNKQYDNAYQIFTDLGNYEDSAVMAKESRYQQALDAQTNEQFDEAIEIFTDLKDYKDSSDQILESKYLKAAKHLQGKHYKSAYQLFVELDNYKDSKDQVEAVILLWAKQALASSSTDTASIFAATVKLDSSHRSGFYSTITDFINGHGSSKYWFNWGATAAAKNVRILLKMLPNSYQNTPKLLQLFNALTGTNSYDTLFKNHGSALQSCWSLAFVKDLVKQDDAIYDFLESNWKTSDRSYYFNFYENSEGGTSCQFNLPQVAKPSGTKYYCFENLIFYWDNDTRHLAKCFRFEITSYNTIKVFCYKNNRTYTLYRQ